MPVPGVGDLPGLPPPQQVASHADLLLVANRLASVEEHLTSYFAAMAAQANAARLAAEQARDEVKSEVTVVLERVDASIAAANAHHDSEQRSLRLALDQRLADASTHDEWRLTEVEARVERIVDEFHAGLDGRLGDQAKVLNDRIAATDQEAVDRLQRASATLEQNLKDRSVAIATRLEAALGTFERRLADDVAARIAEVEAGFSRVGARVDESFDTVAQRMQGIESRDSQRAEQMSELSAKVGRIDADALDAMKEQMSAAAGEAMLVRIDMEHQTKCVEQRIDQVQVRVSDVEAKVTDNMDVTTAVQLERLEDLERAMADLDPDSLMNRYDAALPPAPPDGEPATANAPDSYPTANDHWPQAG